MSDLDNQIQELDSEVSWIFNDVNLSMIMIVLFFASIFATLISSNKVLNETNTSTSSETTKEMPTENQSIQHYGDVGFPKYEEEKGFPTKDRFNEDLILIDNVGKNTGLIGNKIWDFDNLDIFRKRLDLKVLVDEDANFVYEGSSVDIEFLKKEINELSKANNVFVKLFISEEAPIRVYEYARNYLWNQTDAIHWQFVTK